MQGDRRAGPAPRLREGPHQEVAPAEDKLFGQVSVGFDGDREQDYKSFVIDLAKDPHARKALDCEFPRLYIFDKDHEEAAPGPALIRRINVRNHEASLDKKDVNRWIDAPLLVPTLTEKGELVAEKWGVLTVDRGKDSNALDARDAADITLFTAVAAAAIEARCLHQDRRHLGLFHRYSQRLAQVLRSPQGANILAPVTDQLLKLYQEITGAEVVFYRELHGQSLVFTGGAVAGGPETARRGDPQ